MDTKLQIYFETTSINGKYLCFLTEILSESFKSSLGFSKNATKCKWEDGNMIIETTKALEEMNEGDYYYKYEYTDIPNRMPYFQSSTAAGFFQDIDIMLQFCGYFGKLPKNLLKTTYVYINGEIFDEAHFDYCDFNEYGYPQTGWFENDFVTFTWNKL